MLPEAQVGAQVAKASLAPALLHLISMAWAEEVVATMAEQQQPPHRPCPLAITAEPVAVAVQIIRTMQEGNDE
jgi:hypothetical protein